MARTWKCQRQAKGEKCYHVNPRRKLICGKCGKKRPATKHPAHKAILKKLTYEEAILINGGEFCSLCGTGPGTRSLHRDHDHITGVYRGLLCFQCNILLKKRCTPDWLRRAADYIERANSRSQ